MSSTLSFHLFPEKENPFNFLRLYSFAPALIDWKRFDFPSIRVQRYTDRNGWNEIEENIRVSVSVASSLHPPGSGQMLADIVLYQGLASPREWSGVVNDVYNFNLDPEKNWKLLLIPLLEKTLETSKKSRKEAKKREKKIQKGLDKLKGLDIPNVG